MSAQQQMGLPMVNVADYVFNIGSLISLDLTGYKPQEENRKIVLTLLGPVTHTFKNQRADDCYDWYLEITGQRRVQPVRINPALH